jgi:outer membrane protein assembly factor BamC
MNLKASVIKWILLVSAGLTIFGCSNTEEMLDTVLPAQNPKYQSSSALAPLEVPPDLSSHSIQDQLLLPGEQATGGANYSDYAEQDGSATTVALVLPELTNVRVARDGDQRWLVIKANPDEVWPQVREFWFTEGLQLKKEDPTIGIMETDWAENRADVKKGLIQKLLEKVSTKLYSAATRDKFRVRLERGEQEGTTELYLSHRGLEEVAQGQGYVWQPRPSDLELEAEMLNRLLIYFGVNRERATTLLASNETHVERAQLVRNDTGSMLAIDEDFSRAWRRTGLALDRVGFTVEDRDRSRGLYYVRYVDPLRETGEENEEGWLSKLNFWGADDVAELAPGQDSFLISLVAEGETTDVVVLNVDGERDRSPTADRILSLLHEQLK